MDAVVGEDGCPAFTAVVKIDDRHAREVHRWGVRLDGPGGPNTWGINLEVHNAHSQERMRRFALPGAGDGIDVRYYFTHSRRFGAQKIYAGPGRRDGAARRHVDVQND